MSTPKSLQYAASLPAVGAAAAQQAAPYLARMYFLSYVLGVTEVHSNLVPNTGSCFR